MSDMAITVKSLGVTDYASVFARMKDFTQHREAETHDELWLTQHFSVFTQGQAGKAEHILANTQQIPIVQSDRGGQVTYHGLGQVVLYFLIDIKRAGIGVRQMVSLIEQCVIDTLATYGVKATAKPDAPGVYVDGKKIASLGLRVRNGRTYHGVALNVDMDLTPFNWINPCGYQGLQMTQLSDWVKEITIETVEQQLVQQAQRLLSIAQAAN